MDGFAFHYSFFAGVGSGRRDTLLAITHNRWMASIDWSRIFRLQSRRRRRNERDFRRQNRTVATRFDKLAVRYLAMINIAAINLWLRDERWWHSPQRAWC
ncbi:hypothetical protein [Nocardia exalbida]|uniref:hypothetical protein n=1 Tax=Nocardia exalbida TaxID=290231 RepID=UPI001C3F4B6B|nr:hypothetical protein [Nocardia exalbida]